MQSRLLRKLSILAGMALIATLGAARSAHADLTFNFQSLAGTGQGSTINFTGNSSGTGASFTLATNTAPNDFNISSTFGGTGSANGLLGNITGTFSYTTASISTSGGTQTAPLTGSGTLTILNPGAGHTNLTATVTGINIFTMGTTGGTNSGGTINLSGVTGGAGNTDLAAFAALAASSGGIETLSFQFIPSKSLTQLAAANASNSTSFSGTLTALAVPEPATVAMALTALPLLGLGAWARRRRAKV
jgi:hypothetical protein